MKEFNCVCRSALFFLTFVVSTSAVLASNAFVAASDSSLKIKARFIDSTQIEIKLSDYSDDLDKAEAIGIWYQPQEYVSELDPLAKDLKKIPIQELGKDTHTVILRVKVLRGEDSLYALIAAYFWTTKLVSRRDTANGTKVLMYDTTPPLNPLKLSGSYRGGDSALVTISNVNLLGSDIDSVIFSYGFDPSASFSVSVMPAAKMKSLSNNGTFYWNIRHPILSGKEKALYCAIQLLSTRFNGRRRVFSQKQTTAFFVGKKLPPNTLRISAIPLGPTRIKLSWSKRALVRIIGSTREIPEEIVSTSEYFFVKEVTAAETSYTVGQLSSQTRYCFGLQVKSDQLWSAFTDSSRVCVTTPQIDPNNTVENTVSIDSCFFDSLHNVMKIFWSVNQKDSTELELGIGVSLKKDSVATPGQIYSVVGKNGKNMINLGEDLVFDTTYYISLWLRKVDGVWAYPTSASIGIIRTPPLTSRVFQPVEYFNVTSDNPIDTVWAFGKRVLLWNTNKWIGLGLMQDTLRIFEQPDSAFKGLVKASIGFQFLEKPQSVPFYIGVRCEPELIKKYGISKVRLYRRKDNKWLLERNAEIDTQKTMVYVLKEFTELDEPFIALIDTLAPILEFSSKGKEIINGDTIIDTFTITDNVAGVYWEYYYSRGNEIMTKRHEGVTTELKQTFVQKIDNKIASNSNGLRGLLKVSDGVFSVTQDRSRRTFRTVSDPVSIEPDMWTPLRVTASLLSPKAENALSGFSKDRTWKYDISKFRLFRWHTTESNKYSNLRWVEYSDSTRDLFVFDPGIVFWIKTKERITLNFGEGITPDLTKPCTIDCPANEWTDIAVPYQFDVAMSDILNATLIANSVDSSVLLDKLFIYEWTKGADLRYFCKLAYSNRLEKTSMDGLKWGSFYSVYIDSTPINKVKLVIPPIVKGIVQPAKKMASNFSHNNGWNIMVEAHTESGAELGCTHCCYFPNATVSQGYLPLPPSFSAVRFGLYDRKTRKLWGHRIDTDLKEKQGEVYEIGFSNDLDDNCRIIYNVASLRPLSDEIKISILNPENFRWENGETFIVDLSKRSRQSRLLVVGTNSYQQSIALSLSKMQFALIGAHFNPMATSLIIRYSVPWDASILRISFIVHDIMGRVVLKQSIIDEFSPGQNEIVLKPGARHNIQSGFYIVTMKAYDISGREIAFFKNKVPCFR